MYIGHDYNIGSVRTNVLELLRADVVYKYCVKLWNCCLPIFFWQNDVKWVTPIVSSVVLCRLLGASDKLQSVSTTRLKCAPRYCWVLTLKCDCCWGFGPHYPRTAAAASQHLALSNTFRFDAGRFVERDSLRLGTRMVQQSMRHCLNYEFAVVGSDAFVQLKATHFHRCWSSWVRNWTSQPCRKAVCRRPNTQYSSFGFGKLDCIPRLSAIAAGYFFTQAKEWFKIESNNLA